MWRFQPYSRRSYVGVLPETGIEATENRGGRRMQADMSAGGSRIPDFGGRRTAMFPVRTRAQKDTVGVRDVVTYHELFGKRLEFNRGDMLFLYSGQNKMSTATPPPTEPYDLPPPCFKSGLEKKTVPLFQLQSLIKEEVELESNACFDNDVPHSEYIVGVCQRRGFDCFGAVLARMQTPKDFVYYFQPLGYQLSYGGKDAYSGDVAFPCITTQLCGKMTTTLSGVHGSPKQANAGTKVYLAVGMLPGRTDALNYPYPTLLFSDEKRLIEQLRDVNYVCRSRRGNVVPCMVKTIGEFASDYRGRNRSPEIDLLMDTDFRPHHI